MKVKHLTKVMTEMEYDNEYKLMVYNPLIKSYTSLRLPLRRIMELDKDLRVVNFSIERKIIIVSDEWENDRLTLTNYVVANMDIKFDTNIHYLFKPMAKDTYALGLLSYSELTQLFGDCTLVSADSFNIMIE